MREASDDGLGPEDVLVAGEHYRIRYVDAVDAGEERAFTGTFVRYVDGEDLCIFYEDSNAHVPKAIVWSTEMLAVERLTPGE
jgi:hypothetical protein